MIKLSPSLLAADFTRLGEQVRTVENAGADYLHLDIMDGHFVPNISFGIPVVKSLRASTSLVFDVHLMISHPEKYIKAFADAGADIITFHIESEANTRETIDMIHSFGKKAGLSIKPATPVEALHDYIDDLELVLIMTVEPGFGGQKLIPSTVEKISSVAELIKTKGRKMDLEIDGGINTENVAGLVSRGADTVVVGSAIFGSADIPKAVRTFKCKD